jgi:hypothetical protein
VVLFGFVCTRATKNMASQMSSPGGVIAPKGDGPKRQWGAYRMKCINCRESFAEAGNGPTACKQVPGPLATKEETYHPGEWVCRAKMISWDPRIPADPMDRVRIVWGVEFHGPVE